MARKQIERLGGDTEPAGGSGSKSGADVPEGQPFGDDSTKSEPAEDSTKPEPPDTAPAAPSKKDDEDLGDRVDPGSEG
jgi:hypothetical protein